VEIVKRECDFEKIYQIAGRASIKIGGKLEVMKGLSGGSGVRA
jgi:hypothetical protein